MKKDRFVIGALGDSITTAFNAQGPQDNFHHSWATGGSHGHSARLATLYPSLEVESRNFAKNGARAADLGGQLQSLLPHAPDYVTLLIGANDLVHGATLGTRAFLGRFREEVEHAVEALVRSSSRIMVLISGIPNQARLLDLLIPGLDPRFSETLRLAYLTRWEAMNETFAALARRLPANVRFAGSVALTKFEKHHLSTLDFYHPSVEGQKLLADLTWREGFFPG